MRLPGVDTLRLGRFPEALLPFLGIGRRQAESAAALVDLEAHAALAAVGHDLAQIGVLTRKSGEPVLEIRVVGVDLHNGICFVEVNLGELLFLFQNGSLRKISVFSALRVRVKTREKRPIFR